MTPKAKQYLKERAKEPSSWRGMILIITSIAAIFFGVELTDNQTDLILLIGILSAGMMGVSIPDSLFNDVKKNDSV